MSSNLKIKRKNSSSNHDTESSPVSSPLSSSSSPSSSSEGSSSSSELNPSDALQSPLTGLLNFEGFSIPQLRNFNISRLDMPNFSNLPPLPTLPTFNMPNFQQRIPDLANNLRTNLNLQNFTTNMPKFRNMSYLSQFTNYNTSAELQNLFNSIRTSANLPTLPQLPQLAQLLQLAPLFSAGQFSKNRIPKPWAHLKDSVRSMHRRLNDITQRLPTNFHFKEWRSNDGVDYIRMYFLLNEYIYYCDSPTSEQQVSQTAASTANATTGSSNFTRHQNPNNPTPSTSSGSARHNNHHGRGGRGSLNSRNKFDILNTQPLHPNSILIGNFAHFENYEYDPKNSRFIFASENNLYYFDDSPEQNKAPYIPNKIETNCLGPKTDFHICPSNSDLITFHCLGDIWCVNVKTSQEVRLTNVASTVVPVSDNPQNDSKNFNDFKGDIDMRLEQTSTAPQSGRLSSSLHSPSNYEPTLNKTSSLDAAKTLVGRPSHVIREEFRRHQSSWWRPETANHVVIESKDWCEYQLLYEETDQSRVDIVNLLSWDGTVEEQRFPRAGKRNPRSKLKLAKFKLSNQADQWMFDVETVDILPDLKEIYPEFEYLLRVGWIGQDVIWCQLLNRRQTRLVIVLISLSNSFESHIIYQETNDLYWVGVHDTFYILNANKIDSKPLVKGTSLSFLWSSEETGFRHLYFIKVKLGDRASGAEIIKRRQLTEGQWEVSDKDLWVNEDDHLIYFCGLRDTPLESHLYSLSYADCVTNKQSSSSSSSYHNNADSHAKIKVHRLTELNYTHSQIAFNSDRSIFINLQSNISVPPFGFVNKIIYPPPATKSRHESRRLPDSKRLALLIVNSYNYPFTEASRLDYLKSMGAQPSSILYDCQTDLLPGLARPELFCCQLTSGELIYGSVFKPEFMESDVRYPTVLEIYGGPEIQLVSNNFMSLRHPTRHLLSSEGYVVVLIDCRGSGRRGIAFEAHTRQRMGQVEIADQIEVLKWLAKSTGYIDLDRVAIKGWSYGGYLSLMALAQYPKVFKVAIAGAPVSDWELYDSAYTERFMGLPSENVDGYYKGNVLNYVHLFPDQENRLLILHGLMDENVHFLHTSSLIKALIEAGKPYNLQVFPVERHVLKNPMSCENYATSVLSYLQLNL